MDKNISGLTALTTFNTAQQQGATWERQRSEIEIVDRGRDEAETGRNYSATIVRVVIGRPSPPPYQQILRKCASALFLSKFEVRPSGAGCACQQEVTGVQDVCAGTLARRCQQVA